MGQISNQLLIQISQQLSDLIALEAADGRAQDVQHLEFRLCGSLRIHILGSFAAAQKNRSRMVIVSPGRTGKFAGTV